MAIGCPFSRGKAAWPAALLAAWLTAAPAAADTLKLDFPLQCTPGLTCWIPSYVDHDPTKGIRDYACGKATYNGTSATVSRHKGTDFAIRDMAAMRAGVPVLAAAAGRIAGVRDGMADINFREAGGFKALKGKDCGNGVRISHPDGWFSQYCHLLKGSIAVKKGEAVAAGQRLGLVGLSGATTFPHLHLTVGRGKEIVDPFVGLKRGSECGPGEDPLWKADVLAKLPYKPTALYAAGFTTGKPDQVKARDGAYRAKSLKRDAPALILWVDMFRVRKGDRLSFTITGPGPSKVFRHAAALEKDQARRFAYAGTRRKTPLWAPGVYRGEARLVREGGETYSIVREITIE